VRATKLEELAGLRNFASYNYRELRQAMLSRGYPDLGPHPGDPAEPDEPQDIPPDDWGDWLSGDRASRRPPPGGFSASAAQPLP